MKLKEAQARRAILAQQIREAILKFEEATKCEVRGVTVDRTVSQTVGGHRTSILTAVRLDVDLGSQNPEDVNTV